MLASRTFLKTDVQELHRCEDVAERSKRKLLAVGLSVSTIVEENDPKELLIHKARDWNADVIFVGARGLGVVDRVLLGSVSSALVAHAPCTVEVVRHR
jgi:nucleotide-binding universal stress UspA family protein